MTTRTTDRTKVKRYNLMLPVWLYNKVKEISDEYDVPVLQVIKKFIRKGIELKEVQDRGGKIIIIENGNEREKEFDPF